MIKIAITTLATPADPLGVGRYMIALIDALQKVDQENQYFIYTADDTRHLFNIYGNNFKEVRTRFRHHPRWLMRPAYFLWQNSWFLSSLRANGIQVLFLPNLLPLFFDTVPTVVTIYDLGEFKIAKKYNALRQWYRQTILPITINNARRVIAVSQSTKNDLINILNIPEQKIDIAYASIDEKLTQDISIIEQRRVVLQYTENPYIFYTGAMYAHKNLKRLIKAFHKLKSTRGIPHKLILAGKPLGEYAEIKALVLELKLQEDVIFTGYISDHDLSCLYRQATAVTYVPLNEGFGLPVLEAMASQTPVVCSDTSSIPEVAGDAAILVDPTDVDAIAQGIWEVLSNENVARQLVTKGNIQLSKFSWEVCARQTLKSFQDAVNND